jgi:hypothetical protein
VPDRRARAAARGRGPDALPPAGLQRSGADGDTATGQRLMSRQQRKPRQPKMTDEERASYREAKRQDAEQQLDALLTAEGWATWLRLRRTLHEFSWTNQVLIAVQAHEREITPTIVKSAGRWKKDGYHPALGSRGLYVWVPHQRGAKDSPTWTCCSGPLAKGKGCPACGKTSTYFLLRPVFDASQVVSFETGQPPAMELPAGQPIEGDDPGRELLLPLAEWARDEGIVASFDMSATSHRGEAGSFNHATLHLRVCSVIPPSADYEPCNARLRVLVHELAHALGISSRANAELTYADAECAVECVGFIVASVAGLDTSGEAIPYIAGWGGEGARDKVRELAKLIDEAAKRLEAPILALLADNDEREAEAA